MRMERSDLLARFSPDRVRSAVDSLVRHSAPPSVARSVPLELLVAVLLGGVLRLYRLGAESLWIDEVFMVRMATDMSLSELLFEVPLYEPHPPLFNVLMWAWIGRTGTSEALMRVPSVAFSLLAIPIVYALTRRLFDRGTAGLTALFLAVSPLQIWYAQEARMYALLVLATATSFYLVVRIAESAARGDPVTRLAVAYVAVGTVLGYLHVYGLFVLLAQATFFGWNLVRRGTDALLSWRELLAVYGGIGALTAPWTGLLLDRLLRPDRYPADAASWLQPPDLAVLAEAFSLLSFGVTTHTRPYEVLTHPPDLFLLVVGICLLLPIALFAMGAFESEDRGIFLVGLWLLVPAAVPFALSITLRPMFELRYLLVVAPAFLVLLARGVQVVSRDPLRYVLVGLILTGMLVPLPGYYAEPHKDEWREAADYVASDAEPGDVVVVVPGWTGAEPNHAFRFYFDREDVAVVPLYSFSSADEYRQAIDGGGDVYLVVSYTNQRQEVIDRVATQTGSEPTEEREFVSIRVLKYER